MKPLKKNIELKAKPTVKAEVKPEEKKTTKLAPKAKKEVVKETPEEIVGQDTSTKKETPYTMSEKENKVLAEKALETSAKELLDNLDKKVSTKKMEEAVAVIQDHFNLGDKRFVVTSFGDGGTKLKLALANADFEIAVTIKDAEKFGLL